MKDAVTMQHCMHEESFRQNKHEVRRSEGTKREVEVRRSNNLQDRVINQPMTNQITEILVELRSGATYTESAACMHRFINSSTVEVSCCFI